MFLNIFNQIYNRSKDDESFLINEISPSNNLLGDGEFDEVESLKMGNKDLVEYEFVGKGFHSGGITSMDICIQRPIIATCSKDDCTVRLWNYYTN